MAPHFPQVSFYHSDGGASARAALKAIHEHESVLMNDPSTPLREQLDDLELKAVVGESAANSNHYFRPQHHLSGGEQAFHMNGSRDAVRGEDHGASVLDDEGCLEGSSGAEAIGGDDNDGKFLVLPSLLSPQSRHFIVPPIQKVTKMTQP